MHRSHKIRLYPTAKQEEYFRRACGVARFAWNWALNRWNDKYAAGEKVSEMDLRKDLNSIKKEQFPWMLEVTKCAPQQAIRNLGEAFNRFFKKTSGRPKFHKKGRRDSFYLSNEQIKHDQDSWVFKVPLLGSVRMAEKLRYSGKILSATISRTADYWFVSIQVEVPDPSPPHRENQVVGVDLGIKDFAVLSTGERVKGPKALNRGLNKLRRLQKKQSRRYQRGKPSSDQSGRWRKAVREIARLHYRITCVRNDFLHKLSTRLVREFSTVVIEDLNVRGMARNNKLSRHIMDQGWGEFSRQLEYKAPSAGSYIIQAPRFYPSSQLCHICGYRYSSLTLSEREWDCPGCNTHHDRDFNASKNLEALAGSSPVTARGADVRPAGTVAAAMKREIGRTALL